VSSFHFITTITEEPHSCFGMDVDEEDVVDMNLFDFFVSFSEDVVFVLKNGDI
jgi:hypothetical protein